ncbi:starch-binding protein [Prevotella communis]|uniref:starch-binding protein n=1 Tax=Prevotella communis TaxID=2913614 RepID=UPI001EDC88FE|nr:starch-binding protein [Prevotella communis]UKK59462.1 starch-binding protein [Prevotella communis]
MKRNKLLLLLVLLMTAATGAWAQTTVTEPAAAIFAIDTDGTTQDFGSVKADATAQKTFKITNSGNKPLFVTISNPANFTAEMTHNAADKYVYFTDALGWGDIHVYYWNNGPEWPGVAMTELYTNEYGQKVYYCELPDNVEGVIFNGNGKQTGDINEPLGKAYYTKYDNTVGTWSYNNCVPAGKSSVLTVTMNTATLGSKSGNINLSFDAKNATSFTIPCTGKTVTYYNVTLAEGTGDADKWTISPAEATEGDQVTITYNGSKRVKSVTATKVPFTGVKTFSELKTALRSGKNVKLMNDIVCTAEIEINSKVALTIDGNGKKLSATSETRAFKVGSSATVAFKNLILTDFVSGGGPAINNFGTIVLDECTIGNCHVNNSNGGGAIENKGKLYAIKTAFIGNYSGEIGGAINNYGGSLYMSLCTFIDNYTTKSNAYWGGAIGINMGSEVRLINCYFSENKYLGTTNGPSDIGVYNNPTNYTIAGCTGATIAAKSGDITTIANGTATLDYSDLSNISFTYNAE